MTFGFGFDIFYKNFDFTVFTYGMLNVDVYNRLRTTIGVATDKDGLDNNKLAETLDFWTDDNPSETMTRAHVIDPNDNARFSTWFVEDASFLRVKNIQLGYSLPSAFLNRINIKKLRVYAAANNAFVFTDYRGYDPEVGSKNPLNAGVDSGKYPVPRSFSLGLQIDL